MRRAAAAVVLAGCTSFLAVRGPGPSGPHDPRVTCSSAAWPAIDAAVALVMLVGVDRCNGDACALALTAAIPVGVLSGASSVFGTIEHVRCTRAADRQARAMDSIPPVAPPPPRDDRRDRAWQLTKQAAAAARAGDCATVGQLDVQVRELDVELHDVVFARDAAIARCGEAR